MKLATWHKITRPSDSIILMLLVAMFLGMGGHSCLSSLFADVPPTCNKGCGHSKVVVPDPPGDPLPCHDGPCLKTVGYHDADNNRGLIVSPVDEPALSLTAIWSLPPDWLGCTHTPKPPVETIFSPPLQRSCVLRL